MRRELLVGFDPLPLYLSLLESRFSDLAVFCADFVGGALVGVKWRPAARALAKQLAGSGGSSGGEAAAAAEAEGKAAPGTAGKKGGKKGAGASLANGNSSGLAAAAGGGGGSGVLLEALADMVHLGAGLVESVELVRPLEG